MGEADSVNHERYIKRACELAREAGKRGDGPYGAILVLDEEIVMEAGNREKTSCDLSQHAELTLARRATKELDPDIIGKATMYTSTEPCPMCSTGVAYANINAVYYSVSSSRASKVHGGTTTGIPCDEIFERLEADIAVHGPVLEEEGIAVHKEF